MVETQVPQQLLWGNTKLVFTDAGEMTAGYSTIRRPFRNLRWHQGFIGPVPAQYTEGPFKYGMLIGG